MKKRLIAVVLALVMLITVLAACNQNTPTPTGTTPNKPAETKPAETKPAETEKPEPVTVSWYMAGTVKEDHDMVMEELNKLLVEKINVKLDLVLIDTAFNDKMNMKVMAQEPMDLMFVSNWQNDYAALIEQEALLPLDDLIATYAQDYDAMLPEACKSIAVKDGKTYTFQNIQYYAAQNMFAFAKDVVDAVGWTKTQVANEFEILPLLQAIKEKFPDDYILYTDNLNPFFPLSMLDSLGNNMYLAKVDDPYGAWKTGDIISWADWYPTYQKLFGDVYLNEVMRSDYKSNPDRVADYKAGRYSGVWGSYVPGNSGGGFQDITGKEPFIIMVGDAPVMTPTAGLDTMTAISSTSEHPEEAAMLYNLVFTDREVADMLMYGIEGVHYNRIAENRVELIGNGEKYGLYDNSWKFNTFIMSYTTQPDGLWEENWAAMEAAEASPARGFSLDKSNITTELTNVKAVNSEFIGKFATLRDENWDEFMAEWEKLLQDAGIDKVKAEIKAQLDAFIAGK